jgi:hypothetical protein
LLPIEGLLKKHKKKSDGAPKTQPAYLNDARCVKPTDHRKPESRISCNPIMCLRLLSKARVFTRCGAFAAPGA